MAPVVFHLLSLRDPKDSTSFVQTLRSISAAAGLLWAGHCEHWIHQPELSKEFASGADLRAASWDHLLICNLSETKSLDLPIGISELVAAKWSIINEVGGPLLDAPSKLQSLLEQPRTGVPSGWSADDHSGLDASVPPGDVNLSLKSTSQPLHAGESTPEIELRTFVRTFGSAYQGPVAMFNLLSFNPGQLPQYLKYISAFGDISYGAEPLVYGFGDSLTWTSKAKSASDWDGAGLIWYPSIWNFAKMLDDPRYAEVDRKYKIGVIRDNPVLCCVQIEL